MTQVTEDDSKKIRACSLDFRKELEVLINRHSIENVVNMPDFILAEMVCNLIETIGYSIGLNKAWGAGSSK